jgi:molecular chaperone HscC
MIKSDGTHIVGIDLGTTYSLVADIQDGSPVVLPNAMGELLTPSAVSVEESGMVLVGSAARARASRYPEASALSFKRDMGTDRVWSLAGRSFSPVELSALILKQLRLDAERVIGGTVSEAVITVPAYFGDAQRQATRDAARLAGLTAERIINEPTAAALGYGYHRRELSSRIAVLDLGGGTFDVTVLQITEGVIEVMSSAGDVRLGGDDFTQAMVEAWCNEHRLDRTSRLVLAGLTEISEMFKRQLSARLEVRGSFEIEGRVVLLEMSRLDVERLWRGLLTRIEVPVRQALVDARLTAQEVDGVLLVGGASRMPCVAALASQLFGRTPSSELPQDEAVALGAAVQAALKVGDVSVEDLVATDIAPFSLGIATSELVRRVRVNEVFTPILERGTVLPASRAKIFHTIYPEQTEISVRVFQGEHSIVSRNKEIGELVVEKLPAGQINSVEIRFTYDLNGILEVETTALADGRKQVAVMTSTGGRLSPDRFQELQARFQKLKTLPAELLPNRTALELAETLHASLLGEDRQSVASEVLQFRAALGSEDRKQIEVARRRLLEVVSAWKKRRA